MLRVSSEEREVWDEQRAKEVYAWFGAAYYFSEVLHRQLANMYALRLRMSTDLVVRPRIEEELRRACEMTLGQLIAATQDLVRPERADALQEALQRRNFLAHHFWYDQIRLMTSAEGMDTLIAELQEHAEFFQRLDESITADFDHDLPLGGFTEKQIAHALADVMAGKPSDPLPKKRYLRRTERIVRAWITETRNPAYPIFESEDGALWQLADIGLAWAPYDSLAQEWAPHPFQTCLPATCAPRPVDAQPWKYTLRFGNRGIVRVRRDPQSGLVRVATKVLTAEPRGR
jgi:hypothetical protein